VKALGFESVSKTYPIYASPGDRLRELASFRKAAHHQDFWALREVSFAVERGEVFCVIGENGAGKSTLVKLLCRFYDPDRSEIRWDGVDLRDLDLAGLRHRISVVFQDFMAYELSAAENIAVGDLGQAGSRQTLTEAAQRAGVHDVLVTLPKGYDTLLTRTYFDLADRDNPAPTAPSASEAAMTL
jgi:ATP-binding cassette subfamily B protein